MSNKVVAGDFIGEDVSGIWGIVLISPSGYQLTKENVSTWQIIDSNSRTSATSAITRGAIGALLLGPIGLAAALSAKKKGTHLISVEFQSGKKCLIEANDKLKDQIIKSLY